MPAEYAAKLAKVDAPPDGQPSATPAPIPPVHTTRDRFVALSRGEVLRAVTEIADATPEARESFQRFARLVDVVLSREYAARRHALREVYRQFDPDREDRATESDASSSREEVEFVMGHVGQLLDQASFDRLSLADIHSALRAATDFGVNLHVDFKVFDRLEVFARGDAVTRRRVRKWRNYFRVSEVEIPTYRMLAVVFRLLPNPKLTGRLDPHMVYVRLFKNIPKIDLEMLLPGTRYRLTMFDHGKILFPTLSGLAFVLFKLFKAALLLAVAGFYGLLAVLGLVGGTVGYGVRSFLGYLRTKDRYQLAVTQNLYYQNLDNIAGAILRAVVDQDQLQSHAGLLERRDQRWDGVRDRLLLVVAGHDQRELRLVDRAHQADAAACSRSSARRSWRANIVRVNLPSPEACSPKVATLDRISARVAALHSAWNERGSALANVASGCA